jgi:hypothetical protein
MSKRSRGGRYVAGFDTEDDGNGNPFLWCVTHEGGKWSCRTRADFLQWIANAADDQTSRGKTLELWATNLEYDLCNVFDRDRIAEVSLRFGRSALVGARWKGAEFRDTVRHVPASVAELGEMVGLKKLEGKLFSGRASERTFNRYRVRCERDAAITFRAAKVLYDTFRRFGQFPRMTLASTALRIWQERYWKREVHRPSLEVWQAALEAYHGGRTEAFVAGEFPNVSAIDVASMFPWAMITKPLPLPWGLYVRVGAGAAIEPNGLYDVDVSSDIPRPRLPVRTNHGTIYPNGLFSGWYVGEELIAAAERGVKLRVRRGFVFSETCEPFRLYVRSMFRRKQRSRGVTRTIYKLLLNALYGKFGQQGRTVRAVPLERFLALPVAPTTWREWNGLAIYSTDGIPPPWGNNVWPAFVTARARVRLADEIEALSARGCRPLYCDTDSVIFQGDARYPAKADKPGTFEMRGRFSRFLLAGKKEYALKHGRTWDVHAKGIPFAERFRYLQEGVAEFSRPARLREAARDGGTPNVWKRVRKQRRTDIRKDASPVDGALPVPRMFRGQVVSTKKER